MDKSLEEQTGKENLVDAQNVHQRIDFIKRAKKTTASWQENLEKWKEQCGFNNVNRNFSVQISYKRFKAVEYCFVHLRNYPKYINVDNGTTRKKKRNQQTKQLNDNDIKMEEFSTCTEDLH